MFDIQLNDILGQAEETELRHLWLYDLVRSTLTHRLNNCEIDVKLEGVGPEALKIINAQTFLVDNYHGELIGAVTVIRDVTRLRQG